MPTVPPDDAVGRSNPVDADYDPFEAFNRSAGIGVVENPYPIFALARAQNTITREDFTDMIPEGEDLELLSSFELDDNINVFTAYGFDAVQQVLKDGETFSSAGYQEIMGSLAVTWLALERRIDIEDPASVAELAERAALTVGTNPEAPQIAVDGVDVAAEIRSRPVTSAVSAVSAVPALRRRLVAQQRAIIDSEPTGIVVEGRDIGTVVAPDAPLKVFLTASTAVRARRRSAEIGEAGDEAVAQTLAELGRRDALDSGRTASPLAQAPDAIVVDSSDMSVDSVVDLIVGELTQRVGLADVRSGR